MPPISKEARRQQILEAAIQTFSARGFDKTNMEEIRAACGVSKGTLYLYFAHKEALFAGVVAAVFADIQAQLDEIISRQSATASERLRAFILFFSDLLDAPDSSLGLYIDIFMQGWQSTPVRQTLLAAFEQYLTSLHNLIRAGIQAGEFHLAAAEHPRNTARAIIATLDGLVLQKLVEPDLALGPVLEQYVETLLNGLSK